MGQITTLESLPVDGSSISPLSFLRNGLLETANYYGLRTIMKMGKSTDYESILKMVDMNILEHRRIEQSLIIFLKGFKPVEWYRLCSQFIQTPSYNI